MSHVLSSAMPLQIKLEVWFTNLLDSFLSYKIVDKDLNITRTQQVGVISDILSPNLLIYKTILIV